jgi:hypothetical protein
MLERVDGLWRYQQLLTMPDGVVDDRYGETVAIYGDTVVVGAPEKNYSTQIREAGAAYIFHLDSGIWKQVAKLTSTKPTGGGFYGRRVAIVENTIYVLGWYPNPNDHDDYIAEVSVYRRIADGRWLLEDGLTDELLENNGQFGAGFAATPSRFFIATDVWLDGSRVQQVSLFDVVKPSIPLLLGDYNHDGHVDAADYTVWRNTLGQMGLTLFGGADGDGDGTIDTDDYGVWKSHFGESLPMGGGGGLAVDGGEEGKPPAEPGAGGHARVDGRVVESGKQPSVDLPTGSTGRPVPAGVRVREFVADDWASDLRPVALNVHAQVRPPAEPGAVEVFTVAERARDDALLAWLSSRSSAAPGRYDDNSDDENLGSWADDQPADESGDGLLESDGFLENIDAAFRLVGSGA